MMLGYSIGGLLAIPALIGLWKMFQKAGKPGWAAIVPVYNMVVLLGIVGRPVWWIFLFLVGFIPVIGWAIAIVTWIIVLNDLSKSFGKDALFTVLLFFLPFVGYLVLGFGQSKYKGAAALTGSGGSANPGATSHDATRHKVG